MKKLIILIFLLVSVNFIVGAKFEPELKLEIKPYCYGSNVLLKVEESYLDINDTVQWKPSENATILIKHFGYIINSDTTNENGTLKYKFPTANVYEITILKDEFPRYSFKEILLRSCLVTPYVPPEREPYIHIPPVINPPEVLSMQWFRLFLFW